MIVVEEEEEVAIVGAVDARVGGCVAVAAVVVGGVSNDTDLESDGIFGWEGEAEIVDALGGGFHDVVRLR